MATASSSAVGKLSREEFRRQKDLDAARKAGTAPAEIDTETGKAINPHIPQFMAEAPWYMNTGKPTLAHQKGKEYNASPSKLNSRYSRGVAGPAATKFRKGACENCGAMSHKKQDCLERPRKKGAAFSGKNIAADELLHDGGAEDWDAKRDRWDGYDPAQHKRIVEEYEKLEEARRKLREEEIDRGGGKDEDMKKLARKSKTGKKAKDDDDDFGSSDESEDDDDLKYADGADAVGQKLDAKTRVTVRNLRIREDTAKYLLNLDVDSAYYDPKTRSMRDQPNKNVAPEDAQFAGDNFARASGNVKDLQNFQLFAWQSEARGNNVHLQANPTQAEELHRQFLEKKEKATEKSRVSILDKYGGEKYLERPPKELLAGQTEEYVEYDRSGKLVKGVEKRAARSKYDEDVYPGNHTSVWGSWFSSDHQWGFACCHSTIKSSYCAGLEGIEAASSAPVVRAITSSHQDQVDLKGKGKRPADDKEDEFKAPPATRRRVGEGEPSLDKARLDKALKEEEKRMKNGGEGRREYKDVTDEDMEAYRMKRVDSFNDPMANLRGDEYV